MSDQMVDESSLIIEDQIAMRHNANQQRRGTVRSLTLFEVVFQLVWTGEVFLVAAADGAPVHGGTVTFHVTLQFVLAVEEDV